MTNFGRKMRRKLEKFYLQCLLPEIIIDSRRSVQIRDPEYTVVEAQNRRTDVVLPKALNK